MSQVVYTFQILEATDLAVLQNNMNTYGESGFTVVGPVGYDPSGDTYIATLQQVQRI